MAAETPEAVLACDLSPIDRLEAERGTLSTAGGWTERARLGRALRSGLDAKRRLLSRDYRVQEVAPLPVQVHFHIVLFCPEKPVGFWSKSARPFLNLIGDPTGRGQGPDPPHSLYASFATERESSAYLLGAGRPWPPQL